LRAIAAPRLWRRAAKGRSTRSCGGAALGRARRFSGGWQQCFLATYDIVVRRADTHILAVRRSGLDIIVGACPLERLRALVETLAHEVAHTSTPRGSCCRGLGRFGAPREGPPRDRNRFLRSNEPGASVDG